MAKFYVKSGNLRFIIDGTDHKTAIKKALHYAKQKNIMTGLKICYSEQGFISFKEWICDDIENYMKAI